MRKRYLPIGKSAVISVVLMAGPGSVAIGSGGGQASVAGASTPAINGSSTGTRRGGTVGSSVTRWGGALEVPGVAALNRGYKAEVESVSCPSAGNCSAGGYYSVSHGHEEAFVVNEVNGAWQRAVEVPGTAALNKGGNAEVESVSCPSAGNCSAGGTYASNSYAQQGFVVNEVNGAWQRAEEIPGSGRLNGAGFVFFGAVSCASPGNCAAGGGYTDERTHEHAFVANEVNGVWRSAKEVANTGGFDGDDGGVSAVSCASSGNCAAGGSYRDINGDEHAFLANEVNGVWQPAEQPPATAGLDLGLLAGVDSVSCASAGNCSATGSYEDRLNRTQTFVVSEVHGVWQRALEVPGAASLNRGGQAYLASVSCPSAGNCSAGGDYAVISSNGYSYAFLANEVNGVWRRAEEVRGAPSRYPGPFTSVNSVSCPSAGACTAGGGYTVPRGTQAFVVSEAKA